MPRAEIDISLVRPSSQCRGYIRALRTEELIGVLGQKHGAAAIFAGEVEAEIMTGVVAEAEAEQRLARA